MGARMQEIAFAIYSIDNGEIVAVQSQPVELDGHLIKPCDISVDPHTHHVDGYGNIALRPALPDLPAYGFAPMVLDMTGYPAGTTVIAYANVGQSPPATDPADPLRLTVPGKYLVRVTPPWPWVSVSGEVDVHA